MNPVFRFFFVELQFSKLILRYTWEPDLSNLMLFYQQKEIFQTDRSLGIEATVQQKEENSGTGFVK